MIVTYKNCQRRMRPSHTAKAVLATMSPYEVEHGAISMSTRVAVISLLEMVRGYLVIATSDSEASHAIVHKIIEGMLNRHGFKKEGAE